jgi:hypothetical protein
MRRAPVRNHPPVVRRIASSPALTIRRSGSDNNAGCELGNAFFRCPLASRSRTDAKDMHEWSDSCCDACKGKGAALPVGFRRVAGHGVAPSAACRDRESRICTDLRSRPPHATVAASSIFASQLDESIRALGVRVLKVFFNARTASMSEITNDDLGSRRFTQLHVDTLIR